MWKIIYEFGNMSLDYNFSQNVIGHCYRTFWTPTIFMFLFFYFPDFIFTLFFFFFLFFFWTMKRHVTLQSHDKSHDVTS